MNFTTPPSAFPWAALTEAIRDLIAAVRGRRRPAPAPETEPTTSRDPDGPPAAGTPCGITVQG
jgi:hypothetical protein